MTGGWPLLMWHRWQSIGTFATSMRSLFEPCGSWQLVQFSRPAECSQRNGPRFSVWQVTHASLTVLPTLSMRTLFDPCGLWHEVHSSLPSLTGMCPAFLIFSASCLWQFSQVCVTVTVFSCAFSDLGLCTLWHVTHETLRASCMLPCHSVWFPLTWQLRQASFASRADSTVKRLMSSFLPESTCFCPGPWQVSHDWPFFAAGVRVFCAFPCRVSRMPLASES